jgi:ribosome biogenesis protein BMS1
VHVPGVGDFHLSEMSALPDPIPPPGRERELRRTLNDRERLLYAPMADIGSMVYDKDAVYIDCGTVGGGGGGSMAAQGDASDEGRAEGATVQVRTCLE